MCNLSFLNFELFIISVYIYFKIVQLLFLNLIVRVEAGHLDRAAAVLSALQPILKIKLCCVFRT